MLSRKAKEKATKVKEFPITFGSHNVALKGNVLLPEATHNTSLPGAVLCHGFGASSQAVRSCARIIASHGIATLIFDFRGHGFSGGVVDGNMADDVIDAWNFLAQIPEVDCRRMGLIGHSLGAASAIMATERVDNPRALVALACPPEVDSQLVANEPFTIGRWGQDTTITEHPRHGAYPWLKGFAALLCRAWMYLHGYRVRVNWQEFLEALPKIRMSEMLRKLESCPKLFVFCQGDKVTPYQKSVSIYEAACSPKTMFLSKGGFHTAPLLPGNVRSHWISWTVPTLTTMEGQKCVY